MCDTCKQTTCCCDEKRISVLGKQGPKGLSGKSSYIYVAYADDVVAGTPDVVTGFSLTEPKCWVAVVTSLIPLTPVEANFQGLWFDRCQDVPPCVCDIVADGASGNVDQTMNSATYAAVTGTSIGPLAAGTYLLWGEIGVSLSDNALVEISFHNGVAAVGINRKYGYAANQPNQAYQVLSINEKITLASPASVGIVYRLLSGTPSNINHRSVQYLKIA